MKVRENSSIPSASKRRESMRNCAHAPGNSRRFHCAMAYALHFDMATKMADTVRTTNVCLP